MKHASQTTGRQISWLMGRLFPVALNQFLLEYKHPIYLQGENEEQRVERKLANMKK